MYPNRVPLSEALKTAHQQSWSLIGHPGDFLTAEERLEVVRVAREAITCETCLDRKAALSPNSIDAEHQTYSELHPQIVDMIHRIRVDPGRLTKSWFEQISQLIGQQKYVEIVSVVTTSVIIDTMHNALGLGVPRLPLPTAGNPRGQYNNAAIDAGAWLPILDAPKDMADTGLPQVPNIVRALGLVPSSVDLFFGTFRPHYALKDIHLSISQAQAELVASRVSAINECFY